MQLNNDGFSDYIFVFEFEHLNRFGFLFEIFIRSARCFGSLPIALGYYDLSQKSGSCSCFPQSMHLLLSDSSRSHPHDDTEVILLTVECASCTVFKMIACLFN